MSVYYSLKGSSSRFDLPSLLLTTYTVSQAKDVVWNPRIRRLYDANPSLYVEISLGDAIQRTNTIKDDMAPSWEEILPL